MNIHLNVKPSKDMPSNWALQLLNKLNELLETQPLDDFSITLTDEMPEIISLIKTEEPKK